MIQGNIITAGTAANTDVYSVPIDLGDDDRFSISVDFSAAPDLVGVLWLQARNTPTEPWVAVSGSNQNVAAGADHIWSVVDAEYRYVRVFFDYTSSTGSPTVAANYIVKQFHVKGA